MWMSEKQKTEKAIKELKQQKIPIYSISRLNTVDQCGREYWQNYMVHEPQKENIYSFCGSKIHKCLENIQNRIEVNFSQEVKDMINEADFLDINFPSENIKEKWVKDIQYFADHYKKPRGIKCDTEKLFLIQLDNHYLQGIIDLVIYNDDGTVSIIDYKTSSRYSGSDLEEKGRQLVLYGLAMENAGYIVKDIGWQFLKYVEISYPLKNGKIRTTIAEAGYIIEKIRNDLIKELESLNHFTDLEIEVMVDKAIEDNSLKSLPHWIPKRIKEKYTIKPYIQMYDFNEYTKNETKAYIKAKIGDIEKFSDKPEWWEPVEINAGNRFYCENLCGYRETCPYLEEYHNSQIF